MEFTQNVAIILIPIIIGGIVTKFTTNSWQTTKEKIEIKKGILTDYEKSYKYISVIIDNFVYKITEYYIIYNKTQTSIGFPQYSNVNNKITAYLDIKNANEIPNLKFEKEYDELKNKIYEASLIKNRVISNIRLYFGDDELETNCIKLNNLLNDKQDIVQRFVNSVNVNEIKEYYEIFDAKRDPIKETFKEFEEKMIKLKFQKINL